MLVLTRKRGESIFIGDDEAIAIKVLTNDGCNIRLGIQAPADIKIERAELRLSRCENGSTNKVRDE